jgi:sulfotransferase
VKRIAFAAGLPRSGSTLLMSLIGQNPAMEGTPTSPLADYVGAIRVASVHNPAQKAATSHDFDKRLAAGLMGMVDGWGQGGDPNTELLIDKNRAWLRLAPYLIKHRESAKIVVCIRDLRGIMTSLEKRRRANPDTPDPVELENPHAGTTIAARIQAWSTGLVGQSLNLILNAYQEHYLSACHVVRMEDLCTYPRETLRGVEAYLGVPEHHYTLDTIEQLTQEDDKVYGMPGLHIVHDELRPVAEDWTQIIGSDIAAGIVNGNGWYYRLFYPDRAM